MWEGVRNGVDVTGNLKQVKKGRGTLDVYIKHVFAASILVDPSRKFGGWVNCNKLTPTTARNEIVNDNVYDDFLDHLKQYASRFPKIEEDIGKEEMLMGNELNKLLKNYLKDMKIFPKGKIIQGKGSQQGELDSQQRTCYGKVRLNLKRHPLDNNYNNATVK